MNVPNMKKQDVQKKQFRELSDEELSKVTGGAGIDCSLPENKDNVRCSDKLRGLYVTREVSLEHIALSFGDDHLEIN